jgi:hypothetical protein
MVINDKYSFIFQHNPKCAGTFLHYYFLKLEDSVGEELKKDIFAKDTSVIAHVTFDKISDDKYSSYSLIAGLRNPISLYISLYCDMNYPNEVKNWFKIKNSSMPEKVKANNFYNGFQAKNKANKNIDFETFIEKRTDGWSPEKSISEKFINNIIDYQNVYFYKKERLYKDIKCVSEQLNIPFMERIISNTRIRVSSNNRQKLIKQSISESLKEKILDYESTIAGFYNE